MEVRKIAVSGSEASYFLKFISSAIDRFYFYRSLIFGELFTDILYLIIDEIKIICFIDMVSPDMFCQSSFHDETIFIHHHITQNIVLFSIKFDMLIFN